MRLSTGQQQPEIVDEALSAEVLRRPLACRRAHSATQRQACRQPAKPIGELSWRLRVDKKAGYAIDDNFQQAAFACGDDWKSSMP